LIDASDRQLSLLPVDPGARCTSPGRPDVGGQCYTLTFGGFLLLGGRLADLMGRPQDVHARSRRFSLASLLGGLAQSEPWVDRGARRAGLGARDRLAGALSIITTTFSEGAERTAPRRVGRGRGVPAEPPACCSGACLTSGLSWRWVLFVNVPIGVVCALLSPRVLQESRADAGHAQLRTYRGGGEGSRPGSRCWCTRSTTPVNAGWGRRNAVPIAGALALLAAFLVIETRSRAR